MSIDPTNTGAMIDWHAEADRLRAAIEAFLRGDADTMPRAYIYRADGVWSKYDRCEHDRAISDGCEACTDAYFSRVLDADPAQEEHTPPGYESAITLPFRLRQSRWPHNRRPGRYQPGRAEHLRLNYLARGSVDSPARPGRRTRG